MKSYGLTLLYLLTWRNVITGALFPGLLLLVLALYTFAVNAYLAYSLAIIAFTNLLGVPYLSSAPAMRYPLLIIAYAFYDSYCNLCARVHGWPSLIQALVMLSSLGLLVAAVITAFKNPELNLVYVLKPGMVLLALLFRALSKLRFKPLDWQVLKPVLPKRIQAES